MQWDAQRYDSQHRFVAQYGQDLLSLLPENHSCSVLDIGCGTATLTEELSKRYQRVVGLDASKNMISQAQQNYPELNFVCQDALSMTYQQEFDIVFSNAVFHWIDNHDLLLTRIHEALKPGGVIVAEMGAYKNCDAILQAFKSCFEKKGYRFNSPYFYPKTDDYQALLEEHGFEVEMIVDFDRPTPLTEGEQGLRNWIIQFYEQNLCRMPKEKQAEVLSEVETLLKPVLWHDTIWVADYRRLRFKAVKC